MPPEHRAGVPDPERADGTNMAAATVAPSVPSLTRRALIRCAIGIPSLSLLGSCGQGSSPTAKQAVPASTPDTVAQAAGPSTTQFASMMTSVAPLSAIADVSAAPAFSGASLTTYSYNLRTFNGHAGRPVVGVTAAGAPSITDIPGLNPSFACMFWFRLTTPGAGVLLSLTSAHGAAVAGLSFDASGNLTASWGSGATALQFGVPRTMVSDNGWHHLALQRLNGTLQLLIDGIVVGVRAVADPAATAVFVTIGGAGLGWDGFVEGMRVYDTALPETAYPGLVYQWTQLKSSAISYGIEGYYPFNGSAAEATGNGFPGILYNVVPTADRWGDPDSAYGFSGSGSYITLDGNIAQLTGDFLISFAMKSSASSPMAAVSSLSALNGDTFDIVVNSGSALAVVASGSVPLRVSYGQVGALCDGAWHFVAVQRVSGVMQLYVDGNLVATQATGVAPFGYAATVSFGAASTPMVAGNFQGALDDIGLWNVSMTPAQIGALAVQQFRPRDGAVGAYFADKLWLLGGWNPADTPQTNNEVWCSPDGVNWQFVGNAPWERRHAFGVAVLGDRLWVVGGDANTGHYQNDVWSSADGVNWRLETNTVPWANRASQYVLAYDNKLWLLGGMEMFQQLPPFVSYNDVYSTSDGVRWTQVTPAAAWSPRGLIMGSVVFDSAMWVVGGGTYDLRTFNNDVWRSSDGVNWALVTAAAPWTPRQYQSVGVFAGKIWMVNGGSPDSPGGNSDVWYSADGSTWVQQAAGLWPVRHASSVIQVPDGLVVACGSDIDPYNDVWKLTYAP